MLKYALSERKRRAHDANANDDAVVNADADNAVDASDIAVADADADDVADEVQSDSSSDNLSDSHDDSQSASDDDVIPPDIVGPGCSHDDSVRKSPDETSKGTTYVPLLLFFSFVIPALAVMLIAA